MPSLIDRLKAALKKGDRKASPRPEPQAPGGLSAQASLRPVTPNLKSLKQDYLNRLIADCRPVFINGFELSGFTPGSNLFLLDRLYVIPDTYTSKKNNEADQHSPLSAIQAVAQENNQCIYLLGSPGMGKSTFLSFLALQHARAFASTEVDFSQLLPGWHGAPLLPVLIPMYQLAEKLSQQALPEETLIESYLASEERSQPFAPYLLEETDTSGGIFLFDGLDEIPDPRLRMKILPAIQAFVDRHKHHPGTRIIVTCRTQSYEDSGWRITGWEKHELAPFNLAKIHQFVTNQYSELIRLDATHRSDHESQRDKLLASFHPGDPNQLLEFASIPILASTLVTTRVGKDDLPEIRAVIYQKCLDQLLTHWTIGSGQAAGKLNPRRLLNFLDIPRSAFEQLLQEVAYKAHTILPEANKGQPFVRRSTPLPEKLLESILQTHLKSDEKAKTVLTYLRQPNGVLTLYRVTLPKVDEASPPVYTYGFIHPFFEDYLAARYLERRADLGFEARHHISQGSHWRNVLVLLGEILCSLEQTPQRMDNILNALAPSPLPQEGLSPEAWRAVWVAGELLKTYRIAYPQCELEHKHIPRGLVNLLQARGTSLPPRERVAAGDTLDALGDPRFRADLWFLPDEVLYGFIHIASGSFCMGGDVFNDPAVKESEQPQHTLTLPAFFLARNLVTVAQYHAFQKDSNYQTTNPSCLEGSSSRPVVYVNWRDGLCYCEWLTEKLKEIAARRFMERSMNETERFFWEGIASQTLVASLPSEAEWEKAARGPFQAENGEGNPPPTEDDHARATIYPWGNEFDPSRANTAETGLGTTSPVGSFPMGSSPYGVLDMSGNVWEWTRTLWGIDFVHNNFFYPYTLLDGRENLQADDTILRVIRGGSFFYHNWHTRTSSRGRIPPVDCDWDIGFRVAVTTMKANHPRGKVS